MMMWAKGLFAIGNYKFKLTCIMSNPINLIVNNHSIPIRSDGRQLTISLHLLLLKVSIHVYLLVENVEV